MSTMSKYQEVKLQSSGYRRHRENRENGQKKSLSGKTQGILFAQVVNSLILKVKDMPRKFPFSPQKLDRSAKSVSSM